MKEMNNEYQPLITPPEKLGEPALWFAFKRGELLLVKTGDEPRLPHCQDLAELGLTASRSLYLGTYGGSHCYAAELEHAEALPEYHQMHGLRDVLGMIDESLGTLAGRAYQFLEWD